MGKLIYFFPLHPVPFCEQDYEKQKILELVTSLFELQNMITKIIFLVWPLESWKLWKEKEKSDKISFGKI